MRQLNVLGFSVSIGRPSASVNSRYGWLPDRPDERDFTLDHAAMPAAAALPAVVDIRAGFPAVPYDQGQLGSCTANMGAGLVQFDQKVQKLPVFMPARLFVYYNTRLIEGTVKSDAGGTIRDTIKSIATYGACTETLDPYNIAKFSSKPSTACYTQGKLHPAVKYQRVTRTLLAFRTALASGLPFGFGISVYDSFESAAVAKSGIVPMPNTAKESLLGGHAIVCCGYNDAAQTFLCRNSWGTGWGQAGYFTLPYAYLMNANLSDDFWVVQQVK